MNTDFKKQDSQTRQRKGAIDLGTLVYGKVPPQAKDLEEAVLGAIMVDANAYDTVASYLRPESFYVESHQRIFSAIKTLASQSQPIDVLTVTEQLKKTDELEMAGGYYYVTKLTNSVVSGAHIDHHSRIIVQKFIQREIIRICGEMITEAYEDGTDALELLDYVEGEISRVSETIDIGEMTPIEKVLVQTVQLIEQTRELNEKRQGDIAITGLPAGIKDLDLITRGWQKGDLIILAARPSVGKTALMLNMVKNASEYLSAINGCVGVWSLEMKAVRLMLRLLSATSGVWLTKIQTGILTDDDMKTIYSRGIQVLARNKIFFDDHPGLTLQKLRSKARRLKRKNKLELIVVDYLQLMTPDERSGTREQEVSRISRALKLLAQELEIPIIALSQMSREFEKRPGAVPQLSDLRESGSLEQDADVVVFIWNYSESEILENPAFCDRRKIKVAKQRDGVLGTIEVSFKGDIQLFEQIDKLSQHLGTGNWRPIREDERGDLK
jgi:replicative DNA helicase